VRVGATRHSRPRMRTGRQRQGTYLWLVLCLAVAHNVGFAGSMRTQRSAVCDRHTLSPHFHRRTTAGQELSSAAHRALEACP
jgi:hypothetical protein